MQAKFNVKILTAAMLSCLLPTVAHAALVWDETIGGDFSGNGLEPTHIDIMPGGNTVLGTTGNAGAGIDRDYLSFTVPDGMLLTSLTLTEATSISGGSSFLALQEGPALTVTPAGVGVENLLGYTHYSYEHLGVNLLPMIAAGLSTGLPTGAYSLWIQETGGPASYGLDFEVTEVPVPGAALLFLSGLAGLSALRRNRISA